MTKCPLCSSDTFSYLAERPDYEYGLSTKLSYRRCGLCRLVFAHPMPSPDLVLSFYGSYSTHGKRRSSLLGEMARRKTLRETMAAIGPRTQLRVLDYGCGNGAFLTDLQGAGYKNVIGYDFDPLAVKAARTVGISAEYDWDKVTGLFDIILLNHVIEHLSDPRSQLRLLSSRLHSGGLIVIRTPNNDSLMASLCQSEWRGWETPRHLNIMNKHSLSLVVLQSDLSIVRCFNSKSMFFGMFHGSLKRPWWGSPLGKILRHGLAFVCYPWGAGEETVAIARKP